jgi:ATP-binding cassette subfamily B protein
VSARPLEPVRQSGTFMFVLRGHRIRLTVMAASAFLGGLAEAAFLVLVTRAAFAITGDDDRVAILAGTYAGLYRSLLLGLGLLIARIGLSIAAGRMSSTLNAAVVATTRKRLAAAFLNAPWEVQQRQRAGSLQELLTTYVGSTSATVSAVNQVISAGANLAALVGLGIAVDPLGALVLIVTVGALGVVLRPLRAAVRRHGRTNVDAGMAFATSVNELSELGLELHVFGVEAEAQRRLDAAIEDSRRAGSRLQFAASLTTPLYTSLAYSALLGALALVATSNSTSLTSLGAAMLVMLRSLSYGQALQNGYTTIASSTSGLEELRHQLSTLEGSRRQGGGHTVPQISRIRVENLTFGYVRDQGVLHDVTFTVERGEIVGIVGPSGGGKSTLVQLLLGLRQPDSGRILVNGVDLKELAHEEWARKATFVPQTAHLVAGTIADNIRFLRDGITDAQIEQSSRLAHLHEDVESFPEGYERQVGERGGNLSGGQQQRLCIARALVEQPELLILDEPTSALDMRTERLVRSTLESLKTRMTIIVIAHRLPTLEVCDRIMVIKSGRLVAMDTPGRLEQDNDFYREALLLSGMRT